MVWARTKLVIWDYIFEPAKEIKIFYTGPNPEMLYKKLNELIRVVFNVPEAYVQEKQYDWEKLKGTERFSVSWEVNKILDLFTYVTIEIDLSGFSTDGEGRAQIRMKPRLLTEYPQDTIWQQSIVYEMLRRFWHKAFYHHKRMEFLNYGKELLVNFETSIKNYIETLKTGRQGS
mgnify:CR=1 FL=1